MQETGKFLKNYSKKKEIKNKKLAQMNTQIIEMDLLSDEESFSLMDVFKCYLDNFYASIIK